MMANILLVMAMIFLLIGAVGVNSLKGIIPKMLTSSLIDTMAMILLVIALVLKTGFNGLSIRLVIVLLFIMLTTPVINHMMTKAAYLSVHKEGDKDD